MSWLLLDEVPGWVTFLGGALCLAGVAVSRVRSRKPAPVSEPAATAAAAPR